MRFITIIGLLAVSSALLLIPPAANVSRACVESETPSYLVSTTLIRVRNYRSFGSAAGQHCACGLSITDASLMTVDDVKVVRAGTRTEVGGFDFQFNQTTTNEFASIQPNVQWTGFLASQTEAELPPDVEVDLLFTVTFLVPLDDPRIEPALANAFVGTDEANPDGTLKNTHQRVLNPVKVQIVPAVPALGSWGKLIMAALVLAGGVFLIWRRGLPL